MVWIKLFFVSYWEVLLHNNPVAPQPYIFVKSEELLAAGERERYAAWCSVGTVAGGRWRGNDSGSI